MKLKRTLPLIILSGPLLLSVQEASAYSSLARDVTTYCSSMGYDLLPTYANDTCDAACHDNSQGVTAYDAGNYEYFCPAPVVASPTCTDADSDGFFAEGDACGTLADFNDNEASAYPGATESCIDGIDNDGNGMIDANDPNAVGCVASCTDMDGDGFSIEGGSCGPIDCNDANDAVNPGATEACGDGVDNNCNSRADSADGVCMNSDGDQNHWWRSRSNTEGSCPGDTGSDTGGNTGGDTGSDTGGNTGGDTVGDTGNSGDDEIDHDEDRDEDRNRDHEKDRDDDRDEDKNSRHDRNDDRDSWKDRKKRHDD